MSELSDFHHTCTHSSRIWSGASDVKKDFTDKWIDKLTSDPDDNMHVKHKLIPFEHLCADKTIVMSKFVTGINSNSRHGSQRPRASVNIIHMWTSHGQRNEQGAKLQKDPSSKLNYVDLANFVTNQVCEGTMVWWWPYLLPTRREVYDEWDSEATQDTEFHRKHAGNAT